MGQNPGWSYGFVPTPAQWNLQFSLKQDDLNLSLATTIALGLGAGNPGGVAVLDNTGRMASSQIPIATTSTLGGVKAGTNISIAADGTISTNTASGTGNVSNTGTPTAGQIAQWTSATVVQGNTVSGDGTLSIAGALTVTKTNGTAFAASATTDATNAANITSGNLSISRFNGGTAATSSTYWRGDGTWASVAGGGGNVSNSGTPTAGQIAQWTSSTAVQGNTVSGDATLSSAGVLTVTKTNGTAFAASATLDATNAANISSGTLQTARLPLFTSIANGAVPLSGGGTANYLRADGTWAAPSASSVIGVRLGTLASTTLGSPGNYDAPTGNALSGVGTAGCACLTHVSTIRYKPIQTNVGGTWTTISG